MTKIMKRALIITFILTLALGAFTACGGDSDDKGSGLAARVVGTYAGSLNKLEPYYVGEASAVVTATGSDEVTITFSAGAIAPFKAKLTDSGVAGIILSNGIPICQFNTINDVLIINNTVSIYTFTGEKK